MDVLWWWLGVGGLNVAYAWLTKTLMIRDSFDREGVVEVLFYWLLWPFQALFWTVVSIHAAAEWLLSRFVGERSKPRPKHRGPRRP